MKISAFLPFFFVSDKRSPDFSLQEDSKALFQPEMFKVPVCDQVAGPAVHYLVDYDSGLASVASLK